MTSIQPVSVFLNKILALTHPSLHDAGAVALERLQENEDTREYAKKWKSTFSGISVVSNRVSPIHRDHHGMLEWYDQLVGFGTYHSASLVIPELGASFDYRPGTVIHLCGNLLQHGLDSWEGGDRFCYAHFFRKDVLKRLVVEDLPSWSHQAVYLSKNDLEQLDKILEKDERLIMRGRLGLA
jgi:hypothetical protein